MTVLNKSPRAKNLASANENTRLPLSLTSFPSWHLNKRHTSAPSPGLRSSWVRERPDMMSASEGGGGHGNADVEREVA